MILLEPIIHKESLCIAIRGHYATQVSNEIRKIPGLIYSATHGCFYLVYDPEAMLTLRKAIGTLDTIVEEGWQQMADPEVRNQFLKYSVTVPREYREHLIKRRYSPATCDNYIAQFRLFLTFIYPRSAEEMTDQDIHEYQLYLIEKRKVSHSTQNQAINAIKFYLEQVKKGERREYYIERPRTEMKLPTVLSEEEMTSLLFQTHYIKHKCLLLMLYSSGLRMSELLRLKPADIDQDRKLVNVLGAKGKKDRITLLSGIANEYVQHYIEMMKPKEWLFESPDGGQYSATSVNKIVKKSAKKAGIKKRISAHTLRHSFATHLLEHGTDLRYIQTLLGHENSKTTERYAQVTRKGFEQLVSPLDAIARKFSLDGNKDI